MSDRPGPTRPAGRPGRRASTPVTGPGPIQRRALELLAPERYGLTAGILGAQLWPERRGRTCSVNGGGDYAAQMLLGRLRLRGWARVMDGEGSSVWAITPAGRAVLT